MGEIDRLRQMLSKSENVVFFGGAGVSTESGIPDFRSVDGLYNQKYDVPPEVVLSHDYFMEHTEAFYRFYRDKLLVLDKLPNPAHAALARLESAGRLKAVVTQNIDGLHQMAGSRSVLELHGSIHRNHCLSCGRSFTARQIAEESGVPLCPCGGVVKPDVVLYGEMLDDGVVEEAVRQIAAADLLIVGGTSLTVYPAAGLIHYLENGRLVLINRTVTEYDRSAQLVIRGSIGEVLAAAVD